MLLLAAAVVMQACAPEVESVNINDASPSGRDYSFAIWSIDLPAKLPPGETIEAPVTLINTGDQPWRSDVDDPYFLSYHWKHPGGIFDSEMFWGERTPLPPYVGVREMVTVMMKIRTPETPKYYDITVDIVRGKGRERSNVSWFEELGWRTYDVRLEVVEQ